MLLENLLTHGEGWGVLLLKCVKLDQSSIFSKINFPYYWGKALLSTVLSAPGIRKCPTLLVGLVLFLVLCEPWSTSWFIWCGWFLHTHESLTIHGNTWGYPWRLLRFYSLCSSVLHSTLPYKAWLTQLHLLYAATYCMWFFFLCHHLITSYGPWRLKYIQIWPFTKFSRIYW